ncbi:MAG: efflux RND transporter periplasmic adaptor subunit [Campylobacteraceae bacterium]|nr:efflux RND transporter periplasmic adaptor subunit [Campylobacteraceae bacterium]
MKITSIIFGIFIGSLITYFSINNSFPEKKETNEKNEIQPLYWVAPMDANYRRDKAGKSPMGMDLVPFYEQENNGPSEGIGTITISPSVVNNLGVRTVRVENKVLPSSINTVAYVDFNEEKLIHIHPRVEGWIEKLYIKASGEKVKKNQALYSLYSPTLVNAQEEYLLALKRDNVLLIKASKNRLLALNVPRSLIKRILRSRRVEQKITYYSKIDGIITNLKIREGFFVKPGTTIMSIGNLDEVWVNAEVFEQELSFLKKDQEVLMTLDYLPSKEWIGKVDYIYPIINAKNRTIKVRLRFKNVDDLLKPGMFAQISINTSSEEEVLVIPSESLIRTGNSKRVVLALGEGRFKSIEVKTGLINNDWVEIIAGLKVDDNVVSSAQFLLDSESSKTSDFKRMSFMEEKNESKNIVWVKAKVLKLMKEDNTIKVSHIAIPSWKWPKMTMNFEIAKDLDFSSFKEDMDLEIQITKTKDNTYIITNFKMYKVSNIVWAKAKVVKLMKEDNSIKVSHSAILSWKWPKMTMNFEIAKDLDFDTFKKDMNLDIEITKTKDNTYIITNIKNIGKTL